MSIADITQQEVDMLFQQNRLDTFKSWQFADDKPCSRIKLAEAGFYFIGTSKEPDAVQCFLCGKALDGWDEDDDPWVEHQSHATSCDFAKLRKPEKELTLNQFLDMQQKFTDAILPKQIKLLESKCKEKHKSKIANLYAIMGIRKR